MTVHYPITVIEQPTEHDYNVIFNGINGFARAQGLNVAAGSYFFAIYDEKRLQDLGFGSSGAHRHASFQYITVRSRAKG